MNEKSESVSYSPGLEGVVAGESAICQVDPQSGLTYRGYDVHQVAESGSFEQTVYLLLHGELPSAEQLRQIRHELSSQREIPEAVVSMLRLMPRQAHPMDMLRTGVSMLGAFDPELDDPSHDANVRKSARLIARVSTLITTAWRVSHGQPPVGARPELSHAANFLQCLNGRVPESWAAAAMDKTLILYAEHEFNASTFAARVTASTLSDLYSAITSAVGTLKGPLHGGANEEAMKILDEIGSPDRAEAWLTPRLERKQKIMGFGHRVYKTGDSRVPTMRAIGLDLGRRLGKSQWIAVCDRLEELMSSRKNLHANLDLYAAPVLAMLSIPAALNTPIFAVSRVAGWCAHAVEQLDHNRLIRPRSLYTGPARREFPGA